jgi:hypothetical protein
MNPIDLNTLRDVIRRNQSDGRVTPDSPSNQVHVDNYGNVKFGSELQPGEVTTQVPQETFAGASACLDGGGR